MNRLPRLALLLACPGALAALALATLALAAPAPARAAAPASADETIVIIRHGEKPAQGLGQLSCRGLNRALALPGVLLARFGRPTALYAPNPAAKKADHGTLYAYIRPLATVEPLAIRAGEPVNIDWDMADVAGLAQHLLAQREGTYVIAWEHHYGEKLARRLLAALHSAAAVPEWDNADFDSIYVIRITTAEDGARQAAFAREQQGLNGLPEACATGGK
jgi:hypothetical protein